MHAFITIGAKNYSEFNAQGNKHKLEMKLILQERIKIDEMIKAYKETYELREYYALS